MKFKSLFRRGQPSHSSHQKQHRQQQQRNSSTNQQVAAPQCQGQQHRQQEQQASAAVAADSKSRRSSNDWLSSSSTSLNYRDPRSGNGPVGIPVSGKNQQVRSIGFQCTQIVFWIKSLIYDNTRIKIEKIFYVIPE